MTTPAQRIVDLFSQEPSLIIFDIGEEVAIFVASPQDQGIVCLMNADPDIQDGCDHVVREPNGRLQSGTEMISWQCPVAINEVEPFQSVHCIDHAPVCAKRAVVPRSPRIPIGAPRV